MYLRFLVFLLFCYQTNAQSLSLAALDSLRTTRKATKLIDLRNSPAFDRGHIRFAQLLPYQQAEFKDAVLKRFPKHIPLVLYCQTGSQSQEAQTYLSGLGYTTVYFIEGGFDAWTTASRPYISTFPTSEPIAPLTYLQLTQVASKYPIVAVLLGGDPCPECSHQESLFKQTLPHIPVLRWEGFRLTGLREQLKASNGPILLIFQKGQQVWRIDGPWEPTDLANLIPVFRP